MSLQSPLKQSASSKQSISVKQGAQGPPQSISVSSESSSLLQQVFESNLIAVAKAVFESLLDECWQFGIRFCQGGFR